MTQRSRPDPVWGEPDSEQRPQRFSDGEWSFLATGHGIEDVRYAGTRVATRVFFSVRDVDWGSPRVSLAYTGGVTDGGTLSVSGAVEDTPLRVTGGIAVVDDGLRISFRVEASATIDVSRAGPCILHERSDLAPGFEADGDRVELADRIVIARIASGYRRMEFDSGSRHVTIGFEGARFELEDQRNWADSTFKSYCPPLADPQPISLRAGDTRSYTITFGLSPRDANPPGGGLEPALLEPALLELGDEPDSHPMPRIGLRHPGGRLADSDLVRLRTLRPAYLHLLVDLASSTWRDDLAEDLETAESVPTDAVVSVDAAAGAAGALVELAGILRGRASAVLLFERGKPITSPGLASTSAFDGSGITVGGGTRANFASLNAAGGVPDPLEIIAVPLAVASHDDDRRALTSSLASFEAIIRDTRGLVGMRELLIGPVTFRPTFDSWPPPGTIRDPRTDWRSTSGRDGTRFAAAWTIAAVGALAACGADRVTIGSTTDLGTAVFDALLALDSLRGSQVRRVSAGERVGGLRADDRLLLGIMTDDTIELVDHGRLLQLESPGIFVDPATSPNDIRDTNLS